MPQLPNKATINRYDDSTVTLIHDTKDENKLLMVVLMPKGYESDIIEFLVNSGFSSLNINVIEKKEAYGKTPFVKTGKQ